MRFKLSYKIFTTFTLMALLVVALLVGLIRFYVARNFADYVNRSLLGRYSEVADALVAEYQTHNGWQVLKDNPERWPELLQVTLPRKDINPVKFSQQPAEFENQISGRNTQKISSQKPSRRIQRLARRLVLFGADKQHVAGGRVGVAYDGYALQAIVVNGQTVGWLGLHKKEHLANPLAVGFLTQQSHMLYIIGGGILLMATIVAFLLSKHLLKPVQKLTAGTRALTSRQFDTRIEVDSQDELGQLAADFNTMARTLANYERMRRQWISDIAHELRTPLSILRGEIEALKDGVRKVNRDALESLSSEARHLSEIVNDLHELSLADTAELSMKKVPINPATVLKETLGRFEKGFAEKQIKIDNNLDNHHPVTIIGDADRLRQLFSNLVENTLRYADAPGLLKIGQTCEANRWMLFFEDSGPGVPEGELDRLFDRLYRVDRSRSRAQGGSGLGLSICKSIVNALGGEIRATNGDSGGLRIEVELPLTG
ncbi:MAG: ATP-binding protein [Desulfobacterales bacterium]|jgi:two-component system sensor histidine kinase BaeS